MVNRRANILILQSGGPGDTTRPTVTITCAQTSPSATSPLNFTFTFSESVTGFVSGDITVGGVGGTKSNFAGTGAVYTCDIAPTASGAMTVDVAEGVCADGAGNTNTAATQLSFTAIVLDLRIDFATVDDAPMTTPYVGEIGDMDVTDTGNQASVSGGRLVLANRTGTADPKLISDLVAPTTGTALSFLANETNNAGQTCLIALRSGAQNNYAGLNIVGTSSFWGWNSNGTYSAIGYVAFAHATDYTYTIVRRTAGFFIFAKGGVYTDHTLIMVVPILALAASEGAFIGATSSASNITATVDFVRKANLPAPFTTDNGIATNASATPASNDELTHVANGSMEVTWTATTGATLEVWVRRSDASNGWIVRGSQAGSTIKLIEVVAGVETERSSAAQTWTNATNYRIYVLFFSNSIYAYTMTTGQQSLKNSYTSASFNNTATIAKVVASAGALANFITYPRTMTGTALAVLNALNP
jgi:hypothetical protein